MAPELTTWSGLLSPVTVAGIDMTLLDLLAFLWFGTATVGFSLYAHHGWAPDSNLTAAIQRHREAWMPHMARRGARAPAVRLGAHLAAGNT